MQQTAAPFLRVDIFLKGFAQKTPNRIFFRTAVCAFQKCPLLFCPEKFWRGFTSYLHLKFSSVLFNSHFAPPVFVAKSSTWEKYTNWTKLLIHFLFACSIYYKIVKAKRIQHPRIGADARKDNDNSRWRWQRAVHLKFYEPNWRLL